jgi:hypothetical protein
MLGYNPLPSPTINVGTPTFNPNAPLFGTTNTNVSTTSTASTSSTQNAVNNEASGLNSILNLASQGAQIAGSIKYQRQQSGASANRQARIAQCGRQPLFGKAKKEAYRKCIADANKPLPNILENVDNENKNLGGGSSMKFVWIGLAVVALGGIAYILYKKSK